MTRKETLDILNKVNDMIDNMSDEELYDHMVKTSPSFRKTLKDFDDFCRENEMNMENAEIGKKDDNFGHIYLNGDAYNRIIKVLNDYKSLIHKNICRLSSHHYSDAKDILELAENLVEVEDTIKLVGDSFRLDISVPEEDYLMNWEEWNRNHSRNAADDKFLMDQLEKSMQTPEAQAKIWNSFLSGNVYKKDIEAEEKKE